MVCRDPCVTAKMDWKTSTTNDATARYEAMKRDSSAVCLSHPVQLRARDTTLRHEPELARRGKGMVAEACKCCVVAGERGRAQVVEPDDSMKLSARGLCETLSSAHLCLPLSHMSYDRPVDVRTGANHCTSPSVGRIVKYENPVLRIDGTSMDFCPGPLRRLRPQSRSGLRCGA
jgi:hypothetical protein